MTISSIVFPEADGDFEQQLRDMNEALLVSSLKQHELLEQAEKSADALRESDTCFRALFEAAPMAVFVCDCNAVIQQYNALAAEIWGREPVRGIEKHCGSFRIWWPDGKLFAPEKSPVYDVLRTGEPVNNVELIIERPDGSMRPVLVSIAALNDTQGRITGSIHSFVDISERKQIEAALGHSELRYRRLFESAQDGILILDAQTRKVIDANSFMTQLLRIPRDEFIGKELWEVGLHKDRAASEAAVRELQERGYIRYEHLALKTRHGEQVEVEVVANTYSEGDFSVVQCNIRDITARSRLEQQAHEQAITLANLQRRKDEFLAMLSHELRNPLAAISSAVLLLSYHKSADEVQNEARLIIDRQVRQLAHLVDDLLDISRISTGKIRLRPTRVSLSDVLKNAAETVQPVMDKNRHRLNIALPSQPIWLSADSARLEQVLVNLLNNAAKYTEAGGQIYLSAQQEGAWAVVRVRDSGIGISPDLLPHIFELFTQEERSSDRAQGGLGIGLAVVQRLVEQHGGNVEVQSVLGHGSEFIVRLPIETTVAGK